jgi:nucleoside-diphosphate-sugar epimerase
MATSTSGCGAGGAQQPPPSRQRPRGAAGSEARGPAPSFCSVAAMALAQDGRRITTFRLANGYGPGAKGFGAPDPGVVGTWQRARQSEQTELEVAATRRDFVHITDLVAAFLLCVAWPEGQGPYNIGTGESWSMMQVAKELCCVNEIDPETIRFIERPHDKRDVRSVRLDVTRAWRDLSWRPEVPLSDGLRTVVQR